MSSVMKIYIIELVFFFISGMEESRNEKLQYQMTSQVKVCIFTSVICVIVEFIFQE